MADHHDRWTAEQRAEVEAQYRAGKPVIVCPVEGAVVDREPSFDDQGHVRLRCGRCRNEVRFKP